MKGVPPQEYYSTRYFKPRFCSAVRVCLRASVNFTDCPFKFDDYFITNRRRYASDDVLEGFDMSHLPAVHIGALIAWVVASFVGLTMTAAPIGFGWFVHVGDIVPVSLVCMVVAGVVHLLCTKIPPIGDGEKVLAEANTVIK